jgi:hypothetical protein
MRRTLTLLCLLSVASWGAACGGADTNTNANAGNGNATRNSVVETNANIPKNMNANSAPSNVGVLTNDNGNKNTDGVKTMDNANGNKNHNGANRNH